MAVGTETVPETETQTGSGLYRMTAESFFRAVDANVFPEKDRVFLRNGRISAKTSRSLSYSATTECLRAAIVPVIPAGWSFWLKSLILGHDLSVPRPDLCIIRGRAQDYFQRGSFPKADEIALVVEVAESSLAEDRGEALADYAKANLPVYWIVNLVDWQVEVYTGPEIVGETARYTTREVYPVGREVPVLIEGVEVARVPAGSILPGDRPHTG